MKRILRHFVVDTVSLYVVSRIASGMVFDRGIETLLLAGAAITASSFLVKPVINLLLLPINLITFNLFKWVSSALALYIVTLIVPGFQITGFLFSGFSSRWIDLPAVSFSGLLAFIAFSFILSVITSFIYWLV